MAMGLLAVTATANAERSTVDLQAGQLEMQIMLQPLRYSFTYAGADVLSASENGLLWEGKAVRGHQARECTNTECRIDISENETNLGTLTIQLSGHRAKLTFEALKPGGKLEFRTGGLAPGYGLGDHSITNKHYDTDITGYVNNHLLADGGLVRFVSNFIIYPKQGVGVVLVDPFEKIVHSTKLEINQGVVHAQARTEMNYFFGNPHEIYAEFLHTRNEDDYPVFAPKAAMFGLGWEAFGALGWTTSQKTVEENVERYRSEGYPLKWLVIGSGYWPKEKPFHETTSFGLFDHEKYPDPAALFKRFHQENMVVMLGLRICFVIGGPFTEEGLSHDYFIGKDGKPEVYHGDWPESPYYMLDAHNPDALKWYLDLIQRWTKFGVDGYKEDLYGYTVADTRDDKVEPINDDLMRHGAYMIERTGYLASNGDLIRINDFNYDENQDRGPVNSLALAYSGVPLLYPALIGGSFTEGKFSTTRTHRMQVYMMRNAQWAAVHPGMAMGEPPWSFPEPDVAQVMRSSAQLHARLQPYLFSTATDFARDGYPWAMAPLPVAFPGDPNVYGRENEHVRGYEWMIGDALLATPLYGDDYDKTNVRDIYLPNGRWMDYDTGTIYQGPKTLKNFELPAAKTPLFVGGSGIILEDINSHTKIRVYPLAEHAHAKLHVDGAAVDTTVAVDVKNWKSPQVTDTITSKIIVGAWDRHAYQFELEKGHSYRLQ
jgi:alpha-glucosidase (family GH31 glycosyl hydrolase)